jgi:hypothetical protein
VLAVPRGTLALELTATTKAFKRYQSPPAAGKSTSFVMLAQPVVWHRSKLRGPR